MKELADVQEAGVFFADDQYFELSDKCGNGYIKRAIVFRFGKSSYTGQWKNMLPHGRGTLIVEENNRSSTKENKLESIKRYDGMWKNGAICGKGRIICIRPNQQPRESCLIEGGFDEFAQSTTGSR